MKNIYESPAVQKVCQRALDRRVHIKGSHVSKAPKLRDVAYFYITQYDGRFPFILDLQTLIHQGHTLSDTQCASALNCCVHEYKRHLARVELRHTMELVETYDDFEWVKTDSGIDPTEEEVEDFVQAMEAARGTPDFPTEVDPRIHSKYRSFY